MNPIKKTVLTAGFMTAVNCMAQVVQLNAGIKVVAEGTIQLVVDNSGIKNDGVFIPDSSTVIFDGAGATSIAGSQQTLFYNVTFRGNGTKINNGDAAVLNALEVEGTTVVDADGITNDKAFTLKSSDTATAYIGKLTNGDITGNVTVERFINTGTANGQHAKSWQFLATPTSGQTIFQSWQESGSTPSGYGTIITGTGSGFDITTALPSLKYYNDASDNWTAITNTSGLLQQKLGYMLYVRGDRTITSSSAAPNNTNMRSKGNLFTAFNPPPSVPVQANMFQSAGNPYASRIEFDKVYQASSGINNVYYVWDPKLNGNWNSGGYQTLSAVTGYIPAAGSATTLYPAATPAPYIESGQAFLVQGNSTGGNIQFNENCKQAGSRLVTKAQLNNYGGFPPNRQFLFSSLFTANGMIADGNVVAFENGLGNELNESDAMKIVNGGENFGISRDGKLLAVEARNEITDNDTIFFHLQNLKQQPYQFRFAPIAVSSNATAYLVDKFLNSQTPVSLTDSSIIDFSVTPELGSAAADRFMIVFKLMSIVPVTFIDISATRTSEQSSIVKWQTANELNVQQYLVERSNDGRHFISIGSTSVVSNNGSNAAYEFPDQHMPDAINYYRIKAININRQTDYSAIVRIDPLVRIAGISVHPNPVKDKVINLHFIHKKGRYNITLTDKSGKNLYKNTFIISQENTSLSIKPASIIATGTYQLSVVSDSGSRFTTQLLIE